MTANPSRYHAPAVRYPTSGWTGWLGVMGGAASLAGLAALVAWALLGASAHPDWVVGAALALWLMATGSAWRFASRLPSGVLAWDGQVWSLQSPQGVVHSGTLAVHLDLQRQMAVCLRVDGAPCCWIWLEQGRDRARWSDVRRAVYSRPGHRVADTALKAREGEG